MKTGLLQPMTNVELQDDASHYKVTSSVNHNHYGETLKIAEIRGVTDYVDYPNWPNGLDANLTFKVGAGKNIYLQNDAGLAATYYADSGTFTAVKFLSNENTGTTGGYGFNNDSDTGMFSNADGQLMFKTNGVTRFTTSISGTSPNTVTFYGDLNTATTGSFTLGAANTGMYLDAYQNLTFRMNSIDIFSATGNYARTSNGTDLMLLSDNVYLKNRLLIGANWPGTNMFDNSDTSHNSIQILSDANVGGIHDQHTAIKMSATLGINEPGYYDNWFPEFLINGGSNYSIYGFSLLKVNKDGVWQSNNGSGYLQLASRLFTTGSGNAGKILVVADSPYDNNITWKTASQIFADSGITASYPLNKVNANISLNMASYFTTDANNNLALTGITDSNNFSKFLMVAADGSTVTWAIPTTTTIYVDNKSIVGAGTSNDTLKLFGLAGNGDKYLKNVNGSDITWVSASDIILSGVSVDAPLYKNTSTIGILDASASSKGSMSIAHFNLLNGATNDNTASTIVKRDASRNFSAGTITATLSGNASTVTNGIYSTGSYADPTWLTSLAYSKLTGTPTLGTMAAKNVPTGTGPYVTWDGSIFGSGTPSGGSSGISDAPDTSQYVRTSGSWIIHTHNGLLTSIAVSPNAPLTNGASGGSYSNTTIGNGGAIGLAYNTLHFQIPATGQTNANILNIHPDLITKINSGGKMDIWTKYDATGLSDTHIIKNVSIISCSQISIDGTNNAIDELIVSLPAANTIINCTADVSNYSSVHIEIQFPNNLIENKVYQYTIRQRAGSTWNIPDIKLSISGNNYFWGGNTSVTNTSTAEFIPVPYSGNSWASLYLEMAGGGAPRSHTFYIVKYKTTDLPPDLISDGNYVPSNGRYYIFKSIYDQIAILRPKL